jgi:hypothetical protein
VSRIVNALVAVIGVALLIFTVRRAGGWGAVVEGVASVGWWFIAVVLLGAFRMVCRARAWMVCAGSALRFRDAFAAWIAGDAMGNLTPLGVLASEPTKILMVRRKISTVTSVVSVTVENAFYMASVLIVLLAGTWLFMQHANVPPALEQISEFILAGVAIAAVAGVWVIRTRPAVLSRLAPRLAKMAGRAEASAESVAEIEAGIYGVAQWPFGRLTRVVLWEAAFHVAAVAEVWVVLTQLVPDVTLTEAFLLESAGRFVTVAFKFVPYRLGVDEAGSGAVAAVLGFAPAVGVTLALVRRLRIIVLNAIGLIPLVSSRHVR